MASNSTSSLLPGFTSLVAHLHTLLSDIEREVITNIDSRDPSLVSSSQAAPSSESLLRAYRKFGQLCDELASYAADPSEHVTTIGGAFHESNALQVVSELGVADALGVRQVLLSELAHKVDADPTRLRQCMRTLVNRGLFRETAFGSDIFVNNRMSSILLSAHEKNLHGFVGHWCDDAYHAGVHIVPAVKTEGASKTPFEILRGTSIWEYYQTPDGAAARERLNRAMIGAEPLLHGSLIYGYDWTKHGEEATIIDVGGGIGGAGIEFTRRFPKIKVIIQDRASVLEAAPKFWDEHAPECKPRVTFMPHDFFTPQPVIDCRGGRIYFMRFVLHDWSDDDCVRILQFICSAMMEIPDARLYIAEAVLDADSDRFKYMVSMQMMTLVGAMERTESEFMGILGRAGLKVENIWRNPGFTSLIECTVA
ncbi:S-adenosyl-L-methionine-dependent methyltransferase [Desarmillaria ectypa]|nr:S-adenosyl-L-methionine-dependent methyltransferase [Desarmillaria ectypa]